ncbi:MAG: hypothetical protein K6E63_07760 [Lachnospiraceae bacterium]|nr:hypothetical protein [Lachnospiraceae bacterium]
MKFTDLRSGSRVGSDMLHDSYKKGHSYGVAVIGGEHLFVRKGFTVYCIAYSDAERIFRRVRRVQAMMCCDNGELEIEYLVVMADGRELIEIQLPGTKAARMLMEELKGTAVGVELAAP